MYIQYIAKNIGTLGKYYQTLWKWICIVNPFDHLFKKISKISFIWEYEFKMGGNIIMK